MPIKAENKARYPANWDDISRAAKERAGWKCMHPGCTARQYAAGHWQDWPGGHRWKECVAPADTYKQARQNAADYQFSNFGDGPNDFKIKILAIVLTTAHLNHDPTDCRPENLAAMCQRHHLLYDQQHHNESAYSTRMAKRNNLELPL